MAAGPRPRHGTRSSSWSPALPESSNVFGALQGVLETVLVAASWVPVQSGGVTGAQQPPRAATQIRSTGETRVLPRWSAARTAAQAQPSVMLVATLSKK